MDRERGEAYLRLLAEAELRAGPAAADFARIRLVALALNSVGALDAGTADAIIAGHAVALGSRQRAFRGLMLGDPPSLADGPWRSPWSTWPAGSGSPDPTGPGRLVPLGLTVRSVHDRTETELRLLSYSRTAAGTWFVIAWSASADASSGNPLPFGPIKITDNRGACYSPSFGGAGGRDPVGHLMLHPDPPDDVQWFELAAPGGAALRIDVQPDAPPDNICPQAYETGLSAGEHLLHRFAERLLVSSLRSSFRPRPGPRPDELVTWLGDVVAALEAAGALSPASPVPGQVAALCARLGITTHWITARPAHPLPVPWLSLLAFQHRKPDPPPAWDGFAAVAAALPELNGITLTVLGVLSLGSRTVLYLRASGYGGSAGPLDQDIPLSVWVHASDGRWYATELGHWSRTGRERVLTLHLAPALPAFAAWIELLATGPSAEVSARLPLRWQ